MITSIDLRDDGAAWIMVEAVIDDALEVMGAHRETLQVFGNVLRSRGPLRDITEQTKARTRVMAFASQVASRHGGVPIRASWLAVKRAA